MRSILGIDAAWTEREPSGVALIHGEGSDWEVVAVAPSYDAFVAGSNGDPIDWGTKRFAGSWPEVGALVDAVRRFTDAELQVVAIDMPIATVPLSQRRAADSAISKAFGSRGCAAHSPTGRRPGKLGAALTEQLAAEGFPVATASCASGDVPRLIEVYPHPALLTLLGAEYRVPYKVGRSGRYWRGASVPERIERLLDEFRKIQTALEVVLGKLPIVFPRAEEVSTLTALKRYEDALDAVVCAWVGMEYANGTAKEYGDEIAAIWIPTETPGS